MCTRWSAVESLPASIRRSIDAVASLSARLAARAAGHKNDRELLELVRARCRRLRAEFAKTQVWLDCPLCPLRPAAGARTQISATSDTLTATRKLAP